LVTSDGRNGSLSMNQDANLYRLKLQINQEFTLSTKERIGYLHIIKGSATIADTTFSSGDGIGFEQHQDIDVGSNNDDFEALWFDLPIH